MPETLAAPRHLSASSLNDLLICERRWAYSRGIDPTVPTQPYNEWLVLGSALHAAIRAHFDDLDPKLAAQEVMADAAAEGGDISLATEHVQALFEQFLFWQRRTRFVPTHQEREVSYDLAGVPIVGYIDAESDTEIVDWKSATVAWDKKKQADSWLQATAYVLDPQSQERGITRVKFVGFHHQEKKGYDRRKAYGYFEHVHIVTDADIRRFTALCKVYGPRIQSLDINDFAISGATSMNFLCSSKWCPYWENCPGGGR